jgi:phosphate transport system permease protein
MKLSSKFTQRLAWGLAWASAILTILGLASIIVYVIFQGLAALNWDFLVTEPRGGLGGEGGISSCIVTTLLLIVVTMVVLTPLGIGAAIYLAEYAPDNNFTRFIRYCVELLAGVPSIIFGLFGFAVFVLAFNFRPSILAGALTMVCLLLPFLVRSAEEAMRAVPQSQREASLSLGATKWQTVTHVVLPGALPGIVTGIILCIGGVVAQSACLFVTMGGSSEMPDSLLSGGRTLAVHVFYLAMETNAMDKAMATGAVLVILILIINFVTRWLIGRIQRRMMGGK